MTKRKKQSVQILNQALLALAEEDIHALRDSMASDPQLSHQIDALYHRNRQKVSQHIWQRLRPRRVNYWRYAVITASVAVLMFGALHLSRPPKDSVSLTQPPESALPGTLAPTQSMIPSLTPSAMPATWSPTPTGTPIPTSTPSPSPSPSPTPTPIPTQVPTPEASLVSRWSGAYLPRLPDEYQLADVVRNVQKSEAVFRTSGGQQLVFAEYQTAAIPAFDAAERYSYHKLSNGTAALLVQMVGGYTLVWDQDGRTFSITSTGTADQLVAYANSVTQVTAP